MDPYPWNKALPPEAAPLADEHHDEHGKLREAVDSTRAVAGAQHDQLAGGLAAHAGRVTDVHGIANTSNLVDRAYADNAARVEGDRGRDEAVDTARAYTDTEIAALVDAESWTFADPIVWDASTEYAPRTVVEASDGAYYVSTSTTAGDDPTAGGPWLPLPTVIDAAHRAEGPADDPHGLAGYFARRTVVDLRDYGGVDDDATDNTPALVAAIAANAPGVEVVIPNLGGVWRFTTDPEISGHDNVKIAGHGTPTVRFVGDGRFAPSVETEVEPVLADNVWHLDTRIALDDVTGIEPGMHVELRSDAAFESDWNNTCRETNVVTAVNAVDNTIDVAFPTAYEYDITGETPGVEGDTVTVEVYTPGRFHVDGLRVIAERAASVRLMRTGFGSKLSNLHLISADGQQSQGASITWAIGSTIEHTYYEGFTYGIMLSVGTRMTYVHDVGGRDLSHITVPAACAVDIVVDKVRGTEGADIDGHPALNVTYRDVITHGALGNVRSIGAKVYNAVLTHPGESPSFYVATLSVAERFWHIARHYDAVLDNVSIITPNGDGQDLVRFNRGRRLIMRGCYVTGQVSSTPLFSQGGAGEMVVESTTIETPDNWTGGGLLRYRGPLLTLRDVNIIGPGPDAVPESPTSALWSVSTTRIIAARCDFVGLDVIHSSDSGNRYRVWIGCRFVNIGAWVESLSSAPIGQRTRFIGCDFVDIPGGFDPAEWSDPTVLGCTFDNVSPPLPATLPVGRLIVGDGIIQHVTDFVALGRSPVPTPGSSAVQIGRETHAEGLSAVAVGRAALATGTYPVALGFQSEADSYGVALGQAAEGAAGAVAIGPDARATGTWSSVALGRLAVAGGNATAIGANATPGGSGTAVGSGASTASGGTAVGRDADAGHVGSVALGRETVTTATDQVAVGPRDVEVQDASRGLILRSPNGTRYRVTVNDSGALSASAV